MIKKKVMGNNSKFAKFSLRNGTQARVRRLPDCKEIASRWSRVQDLDRPGRGLSVEDYAVIEFAVPNSKIYAIIRQEVLPKTVNDLRNNQIHLGLWRADALFFRSRFYYDASEAAGAPFFTLLEAAVYRNASPYIVPLLQNVRPFETS